jgi:hypothetical protein
MAPVDRMAKAGGAATRRLIVHCGVQKTATTSFHHFAARNRAALAPLAEVLTPVKGSPTRDLGRAAMAFSLDPSTANAARLSKCAATLREALMTGAGTVIVSHENLPGAMIGNGGVVALYPLLERIVGILEQEFAPLVPEYVFYTRNMEGWKTSVYNQAVKSDHYPRSRAEFLTETAECGDWDDLQSRMRALVGADRVRFFRLEDEADHNRPCTQLLRHAGIPDATLAALAPMEKRANPGLNAGALEFMRLLNGLGLARPARRQVAGLIRANQSLFVAG